MPVIPQLTDFQRGSLWGEYGEVFLIGIYTCLVVVTLWRPIGSQLPLRPIGWAVIAIYCLIVCRVVAAFCILYRGLFDDGGDIYKLGSTDYLLRGLQDGFSFLAVLISDGLFCWRLYVIWSRNVRIIFIPAFLLVLNGIGFTIIVVIDFLLAVRPNNLRYPAINHFLFILVFSIALAYTSYITIFIVGRLWWVGSAANKFLTPEEKKRNRYQGAINALVQSGVIYSITAVLTIISVAIGNVMMIIVLGCISPVLNGISATLLVLQLNMYQGQTKRDEDSNLPLTTGASFRFAAQQGASSSSDPEWAQSPVIRRRRASTATCQYRDYKDTGSLPVTFIPAPPTNAPVRIPTLPYSPTNPRSEGNEPSAK